MPADAAVALSRAERGYLIAAAGCGKTETVARAAGIESDGRQLVLTHTHAGVRALRDRLSRIGVPRAKVHVDTIAGFALRYAASYPRRSAITTREPTNTEEWSAVYESASRITGARLGQRILTESFEGLYVDEYQDCNLHQHDLICSVADYLPCRVVLDPMQGIFGFAGSLISVDDHLAPTFERLPDLTTPWRWRGHNDDLGDWLVTARRELDLGRPIDLQDVPLERAAVTTRSQISTCRRIAGRAGSVVAIGQWPGDCYFIGQRLGGIYTCMEPVECRDLIRWASRLDNVNGSQRALEVIGFASTCMTKVGTLLRTAAREFRSGSIPAPRGSAEVRAVIVALTELALSDDVRDVSKALSAMEQISGCTLFRWELWREMQRTIRDHDPNRCSTLAVTAWHVRDRGRHAPRRIEKRTVSRTTLIKGQEFDHAVILNADGHDSMNLYVALTRASSTLTVLSTGSRLVPLAE